jgi:hypothetical protein
MKTKLIKAALVLGGVALGVALKGYMSAKNAPAA